MKKVLILAYDFPPYVSVGGLRPFNWMKYLNDFDVHPILITRQWNNKNGNVLDYISASETNQTIVEKTEQYTLHKTPYFPNLSNRLFLKYGESKFRIFRKLISVNYQFFQYVFPIGPQIELYKEARKYLKNNKVDAIIATGEPFSLFKYASKLSDEFGIPWVADYRDPWSQSFTYENKKFMRFWNRYFEKKYVKNARLITTVDDLFKSKITKLFPNKELSILTNGYDPESMKLVENVAQQNTTFNISFVGTIYNWHPVRSLLTAYSKFVEGQKAPKAKLIFYGINNEDFITSIVANELPNLKAHVEIVPKLQNKTLLEELAKNNACLLFNYYSFTGTKIYDYLGIRRKIIFCYSNDAEAKELKQKYFFNQDPSFENITPQIDIIKETNSGVIVENSDHLLTVLNEMYQEFLNTGKIACDSLDVDRFSRKRQVEKLAKIVSSFKV